MNKWVKKQLEEFAEPEFKRFSSSLLPGVSNMMGVRLPKLRKIAKEIAKGDWRKYLTTAVEDTFEETMLQGMVIGYAKGDFKEICFYIQRFVPKIDNWSVCDSFCAGLKITKQYPDEMWEFIQYYLSDDREYFIRFGVVMLIYYFVSEPYINQVLEIFERIRSESYYVKMAVAWAVSIYYVNFPERVIEYLNHNTLDDFTYQKALQKITDSLRVDKDTKGEIRKMRRKGEDNDTRK